MTLQKYGLFSSLPNICAFFSALNEIIELDVAEKTKDLYRWAVFRKTRKNKRKQEKTSLVCPWAGFLWFFLVFFQTAQRYIGEGRACNFSGRMRDVLGGSEERKQRDRQ
ncbi:MAG: hypothetical protein IJV06_01045 [Bacteroidaceae bacterium]|nr:hypothetical protein [Bacteroidaceae bacterium]